MVSVTTGQLDHRQPPQRLTPLGKRGAVLGVVAGGLFILGFVLLILGGAVAQLNFLLFLGQLSFFEAFSCGIIAVIVAAARRR